MTIVDGSHRMRRVSAPARCRSRGMTGSCWGTAAAAADRRVDTEYLPPGFRNETLAALEDQATVRLPGGHNGRRPAICIHHRFICRSAAVLSRRGYREAGGAWHGE